MLMLRRCREGSARGRRLTARCASRRDVGADHQHRAELTQGMCDGARQLRHDAVPDEGKFEARERLPAAVAIVARITRDAPAHRGRHAGVAARHDRPRVRADPRRLPRRGERSREEALALAHNVARRRAMAEAASVFPRARHKELVSPLVDSRPRRDHPAWSMVELPRARACGGPQLDPNPVRSFCPPTPVTPRLRRPAPGRRS
jgi:hypothetical protein